MTIDDLLDQLRPEVCAQWEWTFKGLTVYPPREPGSGAKPPPKLIPESTVVGVHKNLPEVLAVLRGTDNYEYLCQQLRHSMAYWEGRVYPLSVTVYTDLDLSTAKEEVYVSHIHEVKGFDENSALATAELLLFKETFSGISYVGELCDSMEVELLKTKLESAYPGAWAKMEAGSQLGLSSQQLAQLITAKQTTESELLPELPDFSPQF